MKLEASQRKEVRGDRYRCVVGKTDALDMNHLAAAAQRRASATVSEAVSTQMSSKRVLGFME